MKKMVATLILVMSTSMLHAGDMGIGAGLIYTGSAGLTIEKSMGHNVVGLAVFGHSLHVDYLWHNDHLIPSGSLELPVFYGLGLAVHSSEGDDEDSEINLGIRAPLGVSWYGLMDHVETFFELVPTYSLGDHGGYDTGYGLGLRYHF